MRRVRPRRREVDDLRHRVVQLEAELDEARIDPGVWVSRRVADEFGLTVRSGPLAGLQFVEGAVVAPDVADSLPAKLIGCYEQELHASLERLLELGLSTIVNVGAAEGYYAVGLALRAPGARVYAFETNAARRKMCREMASANGVDSRLEIAAKCDPAWLAALEEDCLVLVDCEGCEVDLLGPEQAAGLSGSALIVELHDFIDVRSSRSIVQCFSSTHEVERVASTPRYSGDFPELGFLGWKNREIAISEARTHPTDWAVLTPKEP